MGNIMHSTDYSISDTRVSLGISDVDIISHLHKLGPKYIDDCYKNKNISLYRKLINTYHALYIMDNDVFERGTVKYINYLINNNTNIWTKYANGVNDVDLFTDNDMFNHPYFIDMVSSIKFDDDWYDNIATLCMFIREILLYKRNRDTFIKWLATIINTNIKCMNYSPTRANFLLTVKQSYSAEYMINIMGIIHKFWDMGMPTKKNKPEKIKKIDYKYVLRKACPIKWHNTKNIKNPNYTFLTKCFFLLLQILRVYYTPMIHRMSGWPSEMELINNMINNLDITDIYDRMDHIIYTNIQTTSKNIYDANKKILENTTITNMISNFYNDVVCWMKLCNINTKKMCIDSILQDIYYHYDYHHNYTKILNMATYIMKSNKYTCNNEIKYMYMKGLANINVNDLDELKIKKIVYSTIRLCTGVTGI